MIRPIVKDPIRLSRRSAPATAEDLPAVRDLLDTLAAHREECVGMAANMIGVQRRIIVFADGADASVMLNPEIVGRSGVYETEEGCLSLRGTRRTRRFKTIRVRWQNAALETKSGTYTGWTAQIIQHEIDHCDGILI